MNFVTTRTKLLVMKNKYAFTLCFLSFIHPVATAQTMNEKNSDDFRELGKLNSQFIRNFINSDTVAHNKIIHHDFVCIQSNGAIVTREEYMKGWATGYQDSGYTAFEKTDEHIRIFGNTALVRSKTPYTKLMDGKIIQGASVYTDTYIKENGRWWCVQAQITAVK
jgi:Domain of unknown function (DUF4440)